MRGLMARLLGRIKAEEASLQIMGLQQDESEVIIYEQGGPVPTTVAALATEAVQQIRQDD